MLANWTEFQITWYEDVVEECYVYVVAGPSGVGKSALSYQLARYLQTPIVEVDDLFLAVEALTSPEEHPILHYWRENPEAANDLSPESILGIHLEVCRSLAPAIVSVIDNHIETRLPIVLEGDYILPELLKKYSNHVVGFFIVVDEQEKIVENFLNREPLKGRQQKRAQVSALFGRWLRNECASLGCGIFAPRPWGTQFDRAIRLIKS